VQNLRKRVLCAIFFCGASHLLLYSGQSH